RDAKARAGSREELGPREVAHPGRDHPGVEERHAAQKTPDGEPPLDVEQDAEIAALRVVRRIDGAHALVAIAPDGRAAAGLEAILDHEVLGLAVGGGEAQAAGERY